jgi:hypothetical protein
MQWSKHRLQRVESSLGLGSVEAALVVVVLDGSGVVVVLVLHQGRLLLSLAYLMRPPLLRHQQHQPPNTANTVSLAGWVVRRKSKVKLPLQLEIKGQSRQQLPMMQRQLLLHPPALHLPHPPATSILFVQAVAMDLVLSYLLLSLESASSVGLLLSRLRQVKVQVVVVVVLIATLHVLHPSPSWEMQLQLHLLEIPALSHHPLLPQQRVLLVLAVKMIHRLLVLEVPRLRPHPKEDPLLQALPCPLCHHLQQ